MSDPQFELEEKLIKELRNQDVKVYESGFIPPRGTAYPFICVGDTQLADEDNKNAVFGSCSQTFHIWSKNKNDHREIYDLLLLLKQVCRSFTITDNFNWLISSVSQQVLFDDTTDEPLLHGVVTVTYKFS